MAYTVKQVVALSGVSIRTLHYYDELGLLQPAYHGANGYRFYEEPQLLTLQQILFYRELGFELKKIKRILGRRDFEKVAALKSHRLVLQKNLTRTRTLIETIDKTIQHLTRRKKMASSEMFAGFSVPAGKDRFDQTINLGGAPVDCKVSSQDTQGAMAVFEFTTGWPRHLHHDQDEWIYIIDGEVDFEVGKKRFRLGAGESLFIPRKTPHIWSPTGGAPSRIINLYQPAGNMEEFLKAVSTFPHLITREQAINKTYTKDQVQAMIQLFAAYGMDLLPP
jgi:DNA-binding transcriptional MerR regulator